MKMVKELPLNGVAIKVTFTTHYLQTRSSDLISETVATTFFVHIFMSSYSE